MQWQMHLWKAFQVKMLPHMTLGHDGSPKALYLMSSFLFSQKLKIIPLYTLFKSSLKLHGLQKLLTGHKYIVFKSVKSICSL